MVTLLGAAEALRAGGEGDVYGYCKPDDTLRAAAGDRAGTALGEDRDDDAVDAGRGLDVDAMVAYATGTSCA